MPFSNLYIVFILLAAIASLLVFFQKNKAPRFWYLFPLLLFVTFAIEWAATVVAYNGGHNIFIYNVYTVFEFVFYFWMFSHFIHSTKVKKILRHLFWIYPVLVLINSHYLQKGEQLLFFSAGTGSILIALLAVCYFYELFRAEKTVDLIREPAFWISSGLLFFSSSWLPLYSYALFTEKLSYIITHHILILFSLINILLYSSFIIAFLCRIRISKFSS